jgi:hypothetical protein
VGDPEFSPDLPQEQQSVAEPAPDPSGPAPAYTAVIASPSPPVEHFEGVDTGLPPDAQPFVVPGDDAGAPATDDGIPDWLGSLTPSVHITEEPQYAQTYAPFNHAEFAVPAPTSAPPTTMVNDLPDTMGGAAQHPGPGSERPYTDPSLAEQAAPHGPFFDSGSPDLGPMGPYTELQMPAPDQLPGGGPPAAHQAESHTSSGGSEQPWYLQQTTSTMAPMPDPDSMHNSRQGQPVVDETGARTRAATVECPNCRESVPDTSLACPSCRYSFFVNCPFCHELVDTSDGKPGVTEPCPYCQNAISKMDMGVGTVNEQASQKVPGSRPGMPHSDPKHAFPSMHQQQFEGPVVVRRPAMAWVVDFMWLVAIIVMVWALTQLPTWLNLPGQY